MIAVREYLDAEKRSAYRLWFDQLDVTAAAKIAVALERISQGNTSSMKAVGEGVSEYKVDFGPGYRIYFGKDGDRLVILLGGGDKKKQPKDIAAAKTLSRQYKAPQKEEGDT